MLRRITFTLLAVVFLTALPLMAGEWTGWITDEHCGAKGASEGHKSCALKCAGNGEALVFYNLADKEIYQLSDQEAAKAHIGHKVKVVGSVEDSKITVESISEVKSE